MNLRDAIRHGKKAAASRTLPAEQRIAIHCLVRLAQRVLRVQAPLRKLERALCPQEELNQKEMFR